tara:strand:- start:343 stop:486 length:144 start_codon:yes stop_codon:yes gene_type:complete
MLTTLFDSLTSVVGTTFTSAFPQEVKISSEKMPHTKMNKFFMGINLS